LNVNSDELRPIPENSRHIVVLVNGQIFKMIVLNEQGTPYSEAEIAAQLEQIQRQAEQSPAENVATLTGIHRDNSTVVCYISSSYLEQLRIGEN
jgi:hypothetical protein